jgi:hypothetical protein
VEHLPHKEGLRRQLRVAEGEIRCKCATCSSDAGRVLPLGTGFGDRFDLRRCLLRQSFPRKGRSAYDARAQRLDELAHVAGKLVRPVRRGKSLDQLHPPVAVLEVEELFAIRDRADVEGAEHLLARGWVEYDQDTWRSLAEVEHPPLQQLGAEVDGDGRAPVVALLVDHLALIGVQRAACNERGYPFLSSR